MIGKETKKLLYLSHVSEKKHSIEDNKKPFLLKSYRLPDVFLERTGCMFEAWEMHSVSTYSTVRCICYIKIHTHTQVKGATQQ
jgi:hypothetical protein